MDGKQMADRKIRPIRKLLVAKLPLEHAHNIYLARTYAYVAGGKQGAEIGHHAIPASGRSTRRSCEAGSYPKPPRLAQARRRSGPRIHC
jgi:hypothetical protein